MQITNNSKLKELLHRPSSQTKQNKTRLNLEIISLEVIPIFIYIKRFIARPGIVYERSVQNAVKLLCERLWVSLH